MEKLGTKVFVILLAVTGVVMLFMIANHMVAIYRGSISDVDPETEAVRAVNCNQVIFDVDFKPRDTNTLEIKNTPLSSLNLDEINLIDSVTGEIETLERSLFLPGLERDFNISSVPFEVFYVVPFACDNIAKICDRNEGRCFDPNHYSQG